MKKNFIIIVILIFAWVGLTSCGGHQPMVQVQEHTVRDTILISNIQYDSVYVNRDVLCKYINDTLLLREREVEFRYKLLHDTVFRGNEIVFRDSIPYEVTVTQIKEVPKKRGWIDYLCYTLAVGVMGYGVYRLIRKIRAQWKIFS